MIILCSAISLVIIGIIIGVYNGVRSTGCREVTSLACMLVGSVIFISGVIALPLNHMKIQAKIEEINAVSESVSAIRLNGNIEESMAMNLQIVEANKQIARLKYLNSTMFDIWVPDDVKELIMIR